MNNPPLPNSGKTAGAAFGKPRMLTKKDVIFIGILAVVLFGVYAQTLNYDLIWDDKFLFRGNVLLDENRPLWDAFGYGYFGDQIGIRGFDQYYRPLLTATFMLEKKLWGIRNTTLRLTNLSLFFLSLFFLFLFLKQHSVKSHFPEIATLLFALHPLHLENIVWIVGRGDLLLLLWAVLSFLSLEMFIQNKNLGWVMSSCLFFILGILSKESFVFFFPLFIAYEVLRRKKITIPYHLANVLVLLVFYYIKLSVLDLGNVTFMPFANLIESVKGMVTTLGFYVQSVVFPLSYRMFISRNDVVAFPYLVFGLVSMALFLCLFQLSRKHRNILFPTLLAGVFLGGHLVLMFTSIFPYQIYSRYAAVPVLGFCWIGAHFLGTLKTKHRIYPVLILTLAFIPTILANSRAHKNEYSFWEKAAASAPKDSFVQLKMAQTSFENRDYLTAEIHLNTCLSLPMKKRTAALVTLLYADLAFQRVDYENTLKWLGNLESFTRIPDFPLASKLRLDINKKLALVSVARGDVDSAEKLLRQNINMFPENFGNYIELYRLFIGYNLWDKALQSEMVIRDRFPDFFSGKPDTHMIKDKFESLNVEQKIYFSTQYSNYSQAIELMQNKTHLNLEDSFLLAKLYYYRGDEDKGKGCIDKIAERYSADHKILNRLGGFYLRELIRVEDALACFEQSVKVKSDQSEIRSLIHSLEENYLKKLNPVWESNPKGAGR